MFYAFDETIMTDPAKAPEANTPVQKDKEPHSPDDLVHMYGGSLFFIAIPLVLIALAVYFFFIR